MLPIMIFTVFFARFCSTYDSRFEKGRYIFVKNNFLAKLLIDNEDFLHKGNRVQKKDRNKMSVAGLIFYFSNFIIILVAFILMLIPPNSCEPFELETTKLYLFADTLNTKIPIILSIVLLCVEFFYISIKLLCYLKEIEQRWIKILTVILSGAMSLSCGFVIVEMFVELLKG